MSLSIVLIACFFQGARKLHFFSKKVLKKFAELEKVRTFAIPLVKIEREFLRPGRKARAVKILKKFIEKTERKVQASTEYCNDTI